MKLSIVIPAYNEEQLIGKCLDSVLRQVRDRKDVEIIVVNNASTDRTREIVSSFPGIIIVDEPKKGLLYARHAGSAASQGDLIAHVDADTILSAGWVEKALQAFSDNPNLVALSGPYVFYDLSKIHNACIRAYYYAGYLGHLINHFVFHVGAMLQGGNFILKRSAFEKIGGFDTNIVFYGEDTDIARRIQKVGRVRFTFTLPMYTTGRRLQKEGMCTTALRYLVNHVWVIIWKKPFTTAYLDIRTEESKKKS